MIKKLASRKFIIAALSALLSFLSALCESGGDLGTVCSILLTFFAPAVYIITEGVIDARALGGGLSGETGSGESAEAVESGETVESVKGVEGGEGGTGGASASAEGGV